MSLSPLIHTFLTLFQITDKWHFDHFDPKVVSLGIPGHKKSLFDFVCTSAKHIYSNEEGGLSPPSFIHVWHRRSTDKCHFDPKIAIRPVLFATQGRKGFYCFLFGVCVKPNQTISNHIRLSHWSLQIIFKSISLFRDFHVIR